MEQQQLESHEDAIFKGWWGQNCDRHISVCHPVVISPEKNELSAENNIVINHRDVCDDEQCLRNHVPQCVFAPSALKNKETAKALLTTKLLTLKAEHYQKEQIVQDLINKVND